MRAVDISCPDSPWTNPRRSLIQPLSEGGQERLSGRSDFPRGRTFILLAFNEGGRYKISELSDSPRGRTFILPAFNEGGRYKISELSMEAVNALVQPSMKAVGDIVSGITMTVM